MTNGNKPIGRLIMQKYGPKTIGVGEPGGPALFLVRANEHSTIEETFEWLREVVDNHNVHVLVTKIGNAEAAR